MKLKPLKITDENHIDRLIAKFLEVKEFGFLTKETGEILVCGWIGDEDFQHKPWSESILLSPDIEKRVKLARVEELRAIVQTLDKMPRNRIESVVRHLTARLAELEKV